MNPYATPRCLVLALLVAPLLAVPARAADWYVDATAGNNAFTGTSPANAWRTITWAISHVPAGAQTIHVLPGTYGAGESTPIHLQPRQKVIGVGGPAVTIVQSGFACTSSGAGSSLMLQFGPDTEIRGFSIEGAGNGVELSTSFGEMSTTLADLRISGSSHTGVWFNSSSGQSTHSKPTLRRVEIQGCANGLLVDSFQFQPITLTARDCDFSGNAGTGVGVFGLTMTVELRRCRIDDNGQWGLYVEGSGTPVDVLVEDSALTRNGSDGCRLKPEFGAPPTTIGLVMRRATIADNAGAGISALPSGPHSFPVSLSSCIVDGNNDDLVHGSNVTASHCDVGDADFAGQTGNFSAPPAFRDRTNGDYRLTWGSACVDSGDPADPAAGFDLAGVRRPVDGDLDAGERTDVGAFEFAPLEQAGSATIGTALALELWGPQGNATTVYFTRGPLSAAQPTPFGEVDLDPSTISVFRTATVGSGPPTILSRPIPLDPTLVGRVFSFQALTSSAAAPAGSAYTNPVEVAIGP